MVRDAESYSEKDKERKELIEARNEADSLVYSTEKSVQEHKVGHACMYTYTMLTCMRMLCWLCSPCGFLRMPVWMMYGIVLHRG